MLIFKFTKTDSAALVSHVDNLRAVTYLLRRAGVDVEYSQGFNPHMELGFSAPIALGVESLAEYVSVRTAESADILDRLNAASPAGIRFVRQWHADVNLAATFDRARYRLQAMGLGDVAEEITAPAYQISYDDRGTPVTKDVSDRIYDVERIDSDTALVTLAIGNANLRPDRVVLHLMKKYDLQGDYRITKLAAYVQNTHADDYLDEAARRTGKVTRL